MNILTQISTHLLDVIEGENWTDVNIMDSLKDVTVQEATLKTKASPNTIAALVNHLIYWNRVMIQRINGIRVTIPDVNGFDVPGLTSEQDWTNLKKELVASAYELAEAIKKVNESRLPEPIVADHSSTYRNLQGTVEHLHYHLGQIVILKKLIKAGN
ncbi:DinB family protein [Chitinophaga filiformis]|uniref:DinB family protein n=1 Tax=Chitinophaga filiformis TaxID=104663 RepID=UPI001F222133|nr:DinB family protein [Chitinophaga filiformis]MCF6402548.1 DinB family protein [Chitinophaga filiformis]MCF6403534.1 DinB family protein [Chitinophaga filiformis]